MKKLFVTLVLVVCAIMLAGCVSLQQQATQNAMAQIEQDTGLAPVEVPDTEKSYLGKTHRGYKVLFHGEAGNVWGRYTARIAMGEIGREVGGILSFLTGSYEYGGDAAGSIMDRLLAKVIGQPLSITMILVHKKPNVPRLDVLSNYSTVKPNDVQPKGPKVGFGAGYVYSADKAYVDKVAGNQELMARMKKMRSQYIRVDAEAVTLLWAGQETDYSAMIREYKGYSNMLNAFLNTLADLADAAPSR